MNIREFALKKISHFMIKRGLNKKRLAEKSQLPPPSVYKVFSGQRAVTLNFLEKIARGLECSIGEFLPPPQSLDLEFPREELQKALQHTLTNLKTRNSLKSSGVFDELTTGEQTHLQGLVNRFGGWKFLLSYLEEELEIRQEAQRNYKSLRDSITSNMSMDEVQSIKKNMIVTNMISKINKTGG